MTSRFDPLDFAQEHFFAGSTHGRGRRWDEKFYPENGQKLVNLLEEHFHVFAVGFRELRAARLAVCNHGATGSASFLYELPFQIPDVGFGQVLVFADEIDNLVPKVFVEVRFDAIPDTFGFPNINRRFSRLGVASSQEVHTGFF